MSYPYYTGTAGKRPEQPVALPAIDIRESLDPAGYLPDQGLVDAVNVALTLGQPLLLTGEPGTGKTQLAYSLAWELGLRPPLKFETRSASVAKDLFYTFDTVGRFYAAQTGSGSSDPRDYLTFNALGTAILRACPAEKTAAVLPQGLELPEASRSLVLIDEVDKAPRDFPNDILNEIDGMYFRIPELNNTLIAAAPANRPVVVLTSNSEKHLPDAFLRRCAFYHIPFPDSRRLQQIIEKRLGQYAGKSSRFLDDALQLFQLLREPAGGLRKKPATAELLGWLTVLRQRSAGEENPFRSHRELILSTLGSLIKTADDQQQARAMVQDWLARLD